VIDLILSLDYEVFGNGSGDVRRDMIEPTRRLVQLCDAHGAKLTIFLEVAEYWAIQEAEKDGALSLGYSASLEIEEQIRNAVLRGHDVQLHLHPWWIGAAFEDGRWRLRPELRRLSDLPGGIDVEGGVDSVAEVLSRGKETLEGLLRPVDPAYECVAYRAAMFWGQPSESLIAGMKQAGLAADSSVVNGMYETDPVPTDYRDAEAGTGYWWTGSDNISRSGKRGEHIVEFPVCTMMKPYLSNFRWTKLRTTLKRRAVEKVNINGHGMMEARKSRESVPGILKKLCTLQPLKFDFCKLSEGDMIRWLHRLLEDGRPGDDDLGTPVVMLGHSKDFWNDDNLAAFLRYVKNHCRGRVRFRTLGEMTRQIVQRDKVSSTALK